MEQTQTSWRNDPRLKGMDPKKLDLLVSFSNRIAHMPKNELLGAFMELNQETMKQGIQFSDLFIPVGIPCLPVIQKTVTKKLKYCCSSNKMLLSIRQKTIRVSGCGGREKNYCEGVDSTENNASAF